MTLALQRIGIGIGYRHPALGRVDLLKDHAKATRFNHERANSRTQTHCANMQTSVVLVLGLEGFCYD